MIAQALESGFSALVLTADLPVYGIRHGEARLGFAPPEENVPAIVSARARGGEADRHHALGLLESGLQWDYVTELRERWKVPIIVKGLVTAEDALLACQHGASAVVVSNHGGRQLDGAIASLEALPEVVEAVGDRAEVYLDGGVRRGSDVVMALALGARAVLVGRPAMYGLAVRRREGRAAGARDPARRGRERARPARLPLPGRGHARARDAGLSAVSVAELTRNAVHVLPEGALEKKLALGRPLRVKLGIDVTAPGRPRWGTAFRCSAWPRSSAPATSAC